MKVSSNKREVAIEFKRGGKWIRETYPVTDDWDDEDFDNLADNLGEELRFFIQNGELDGWDEPD